MLSRNIITRYRAIRAEQDRDIDERAELIADILTKLLGDDDADNAIEGPNERIVAYSPDQSRAPKGSAGGGRFVGQGGGAEAHAAVKKILSGGHTPEAASHLAGHLSKMTVRELHSLRREHQLSASGRTKQILVQKIGDRLRRGRMAEPPKPKGASRVTVDAYQHYGTKPWLASISGTHKKYGLERSFIPRTSKDTSRSGATGTHSWDLDEPGLYQLGGTKRDDEHLIVYHHKEKNGLHRTAVDASRARAIAKMLDQGHNFEDARLATKPAQ